MFTDILKMLRQPVTLTTVEMAARLNSDTQTVLAALEQLERMGYLCNPCSQGNHGHHCKVCSGCSLSSTNHTSTTRSYSLPYQSCPRI